jgi:hypothetical protein
MSGQMARHLVITAAVTMMFLVVVFGPVVAAAQGH